MAEQNPPTVTEHKFTQEERKGKISNLLHTKDDTKKHINELDAMKTGIDPQTGVPRDPGIVEHFNNTTDRMFGALDSGIKMIEYELDYAIGIAKIQRESEVKGDIRGRELDVIDDLLDKITDHLNLAFKGMKHLSTQLRSAEKIGYSQYKPKKGIIGKNVERVHELADQTSRTITAGIIPLKRRREIKGK
jgi:hypothetical protein